MALWSTKYNSYLVGNEEARQRLKEWLQDFQDRKPGTKRAALLIGPAGTGKTSAAYQALKEADCQVVEQNAGAVRTRKSFENTILQTVNSGPLFGKTNALLLPNVDVMNPSLGGLELVMHVVNPLRGLNRAVRAQDRVEAAKVWTVPIILTTNEAPKGRLADLERDSEVICFDRLPHDKLVLLARHVLSHERLTVSDREIDAACHAADGDARSMLNILQSGLKDSTDKAETMLESACNLLYPDKPVTIGVLFKATSDDVLGTTSAYFENYLDSPELAPSGAQTLSDADVVEARLFQRQEWDLLPYVGLIGCSSALYRPVIGQKPSLKRSRGRPNDTSARALGHGSTRNKAAFISAKQKQESALRSQLLLEGHGDASLERLAFLEGCLRRLLGAQDVAALATFLSHSRLSIESAESILRTVGFGQALGFSPSCFSFPSAVERKDLHRLQSVPYMVAEKTDGVRYLLAVVGGSAALVGRNMSTIGVTLAGGKLEGDTLLDGELVSMKKDPTSRRFVVYDALRTSRGQVASFNLRERMQALTTDFLDKAVQGWTLVLPNNRKVPVERKGLVPFQEGLSYARTVVPTLPYRSDGLVFTPVDEPIRFGTCSTLFKWKILEANTVDFLLDANGGPYTLSVMDRGREIAVAETWLAEGSMIKMLVDMDIQRGKRPIYECAWDPRTNTWQPRKARPDKAGPNSIMTFRATIRNLEEDVKLEDIFTRAS